MVAERELREALGLTKKLTSAELFDVEGQTPLSDEDLLGLIPEHIETRAQLNEWEAANIMLARRQLARRKQAFDVSSTAGLIALHRLMFGRTWTWAGQYAKSLTQFSDPRTPRSVQLHELVANTNETLRTSNRSPADLDEIAMRFHHRLTQIHAWPNGNGRHAREATDQLLRRLGRRPFVWGADEPLIAKGDVREAYISALKAADAGDFSHLRLFLRSPGREPEKT